MIEVEIVNSGNPYKAAKLRLPEEPAVLRKKLQAIGAEEQESEITNVRCYPGSLEALVTKHTSIAFLNQLALRLQKLPVPLLDQMEAFLEAKSDCTFLDLFCLLDQWERPRHLKEAILYLPAVLQTVQLECCGKDSAWQSRRLPLQEAALYLESWNRQIKQRKLAEEGCRGWACYLRETELESLVFSIEPLLTIREEALYLQLNCAVKRILSREEAQALEQACLAICQKRLGQIFLSAHYPKEDKKLQLSVFGTSARILYPKEAAAEQKPALRTKEPVLTVALYPKEPDCAEADILLSLPASYWSVQDGLHRLGVEEEAALLIHFVDCPRLPVFSDWLWSQTEQGSVLGTLSEWNYLALLLEGMDSFADKRLEALAEALEESRTDTIQAVIGFVLWAADGVFLESILDDAALGKFCLESGYLKDQARFLEQMKGYLDYSQIGKSWREADGGIYTPIGYLAGAPEQPPMEAPAFLVPDGDCFLQICLEAASGEKETVMFPKDQARYNPEAWKRRILMAKSVSIDCVVPGLIAAVYEDLEELELLQALGARLWSLAAEGQIVPFQALLEARHVFGVEDALRESDQLGDYQYFGDCRSAHCFGRKLFELQCNLELTEEERQTIQFRRYGKLMAVRLGAVETSYGYLLPKGGWIEE